MSSVSTMTLQSSHAGISNDSEVSPEFDILAAVVSQYQQVSQKQKSPSPEHRISCHRCGNIRKRRVLCPNASCPHTFCGRCSEKMKEEHGNGIFVDGCPVCKELCCCSNKSVSCHRLNHCYRKCPATKAKMKLAAVQNSSLTTSGIANEGGNTDSDGGDSTAMTIDEGLQIYTRAGFGSTSLSTAVQIKSPIRSDGGQYGIYELLAAVANTDQQAARDLEINEYLDKCHPVSSGVASKFYGNKILSSDSETESPRKRTKHVVKDDHNRVKGAEDSPLTVPIHESGDATPQGTVQDSSSSNKDISPTAAINLLAFVSSNASNL